MLKAPFPWFGGKSTVADIVWKVFGPVTNYVEPFFGSGAVLLARSDGFTGPETVNDFDGFLANFWRAIRHDPEAVAQFADWPVNENDLHARHAWILARRGELTAALEGDPDFFDAKLAGWWVWGLCAWIGSGWCSGSGPWCVVDGRLVDSRQLPHLGNAGMGINRQRPHLGNAGMGINRQLPHLGNAGMGINRQLPHLGDAGMGINRQLPHLGNAGRGINRKLPHLGDAGMGINRKLPHLGDAGMGDRYEAILATFQGLSDRLRNVRVCCGDWSRVMGESVTTKHPGVTGVFLDPPYADTAGRTDGLYSCDDLSVAHDVREWAIANGDNPRMRIALCGYEDEHQMPNSWACIPWKTSGGYGSQGETKGRENATKERIWLSPACLPLCDAVQPGLFEDAV